MNYTLNYNGGGGSGTQSHMAGGIPVHTPAQHTIVLTSPPPQGPSVHAPLPANVNENNTSSSNHQVYPVMMQVGNGGNSHVIYTYQTNGGISPVSPVQSSVNMHGNSRSPTVQTLSIASEHDSNAGRSIGEIFNVQGISSVSNPGSIVQPTSVGTAAAITQPQASELANLLSSIHLPGLQIVEATANENCTSAITLPVISSQLPSNEINGDKVTVSKLINSLQASGMQVVKNNSDKTISISLPNGSFESGSNAGETNL